MTRINSDGKIPSKDDEIDEALKEDESGVSQWTTVASFETEPGDQSACLGGTCQGRTEPVIAGRAGRISFPDQRTNNFLHQTRQGRPPALPSNLQKPINSFPYR